MTELRWQGKRVPQEAPPAELTCLEAFEPDRPLDAGDDRTSNDRTSNDRTGDDRTGDDRTAAALAPQTGPYNLLLYGDNRSLMSRLLAEGWRGRFRLIYADPPYNSGVEWSRKVRLRGAQGRGGGPAADQVLQYADTWNEGEYLQFLYERLPLLRELLADNGSFWLHCDHRHAHHLRCLLEEVFGARNYLNTITWRSQTARGAKVNAFYFPHSAHTILVFAKHRAYPTLWRAPKKKIVLTEAQAAHEFMRDDKGFFRTSDPGAYTYASLERLHAEGRLYAPFGGEVVLDPIARRAYCTNGGNIGVKYYLTPVAGGRHLVERAVDNIWDDIPGLGTTPGEDMGYPTQKTEALLERIITTATQRGDWVLDPFAGSGTTLAVAQKLGRRWAGCDAVYGAIQTATRRLQAVGQKQHQAMVERATAQGAPDHGAPDHGAPDHGATGDFALWGAMPPPPPDCPPQVSLSITPIGASPARIRVVVDRVTWPTLRAETPTVADWRTAIDSIAIDPAYDGQRPRFTCVDAPLKKSQLVTADYTLAASPPPAQVAVRVVDVWGGEALVVTQR